MVVRNRNEIFRKNAKFLGRWCYFSNDCTLQRYTNRETMQWCFHWNSQRNAKKERLSLLHEKERITVFSLRCVLHTNLLANLWRAKFYFTRVKLYFTRVASGSDCTWKQHKTMIFSYRSKVLVPLSNSSTLSVLSSQQRF